MQRYGWMGVKRKKIKDKFLGQKGFQGLKGEQNMWRWGEADKWNSAWKPTFPLMWMLARKWNPPTTDRNAGYSRKSIRIFPSVLKWWLTETPVHFPSTPNSGALWITCKKASQVASDPQAGGSEEQACVGAQRTKSPFFLGFPSSWCCGRAEAAQAEGSCCGT